MEIWDVYDKDRSKTGKKVERGRPLDEGEMHLVVYACIFDAKNQMLIQHRQPFKEGFPNKWDFTAGGSAVAGDSSQKAVERELFEEIGYNYDFSNIRPHFTINGNDAFCDFYLIEAEINIDTLTLQPEEVESVKWASKDEIFAMVDSGDFIPYHKSLIELCFDMRGRYDTRFY